MTLHRLIVALLGLALVGCLIWAASRASILADGSAMLALPWGVATFLDLFTGFFLAASVILAVEPNRKLGIVLALLVFPLGNIVTAAWAVWRAPLLWRRLAQPAPSASPLASTWQIGPDPKTASRQRPGSSAASRPDR